MSLESVANDRLRHRLIGDARVSKADGSQSLGLQRDALRAVGLLTRAGTLQNSSGRLEVAAPHAPL